ncbi:SIMPL domain-containing protein [Candidatus Parcubacteria bacterium]|nr:SIMPL domain-containing protein [Candidatus Parcubacteria bacterium]
MNEYFDTIEVKRFFKVATLAVCLLAVFLVAKSLSAFKDWSSPSTAQSTIVVTGQGEAYSTPDIASFSFSVSADAAGVASAQDTVTKKTDAILVGLKDLGVDEKDIRTTDYSVYPKYVYQQSVCTVNSCPPSRQVADGYTVSHTITVKVRKTDDAGKALALAGEKGATNISSISFTVDDPNAIQAEARDKAIKDAKTKAEALSKSLGVRLGRVVDFSEGQSGGGPYPMYAYDTVGISAGKSTAPTLPVGQNKVIDNVSVTYEIR